MIHVQQNISLAPFTTFHLGGVASYFVEVSGAIELAESYEYAEEHKLPIFVLGGGSNVVFADTGFPGLVVRMIDGGIIVTDQKIIAGAGISLFEVVKEAAAAGLSGVERLAGIPGSFGGAVRGNAGAFGMEIGAVVAVVKCLDRNTGMVSEYQNTACAFGYRTSLFKKNPHIIILSAEIKLTRGDSNDLTRIMNETVAMREAKHPQDAKCAGSFFMNPEVNDKRLHDEFMKDTGTPSKDGKLPAGWLIDHVGLRGRRIGGAMVSERHPNYLVNTGKATANDVAMLASLIKTRVRDELKVRLQEEVQYVGF